MRTLAFPVRLLPDGRRWVDGEHVVSNCAVRGCVLMGAPAILILFSSGKSLFFFEGKKRFSRPFS